ncbi:hypothetical protein DVDV_2333 [Desulfovibrio sp. DV]|nr:hypothetical protein DVDV_2333 [Desulfovibrio sp. DV]
MEPRLERLGPVRQDNAAAGSPWLCRNMVNLLHQQGLPVLSVFATF